MNTLNSIQDSLNRRFYLSLCHNTSKRLILFKHVANNCLDFFLFFTMFSTSCAVRERTNLKILSPNITLHLPINF